MQEYSVGGCAGMGELLAEANAIGREYAALINSLSRCSNAIIAGLDGSGYFSSHLAFYKLFNIKIGQKQTAQVYDTRIDSVLPYAIKAWIDNETLRFEFVPNPPPLYLSWQQQQQVLFCDMPAAQIRVVNYMKKHIKSCLDWLKSDWVISLQINYALGEIVIPKSQ